MVNKLLQLELDGKPLGNYTTDEKGEAQFSINTSEIFEAQMSLKVRHPRAGRDCQESHCSPNARDLEHRRLLDSSIFSVTCLPIQ